MEISNKAKLLKKGQTFKSYPDLCKHLEEKSYKQGSNGYKAQQKRWKIFFTYKKIEEKSQKIQITKTYNELKKSNDKRIKDYVILIEGALLNYFRKIPYGIYSKNSLLRNTFMCNSAFTQLRQTEQRKELLSKYLNMDINIINDFFELTYNMLIRTLETALKQLEFKQIIKFENDIMVCKVSDTKNIQLETIEIKNKNIYGEEITQHKVKIDKVLGNKYCIASKVEKKKIKELEDYYCKKYECEKKSDLIKIGKWNISYQGILKILKDKYNILHYYNCYKINFLEDIHELTYKNMNLEVINEYIKENILINTMKAHDKLIDHPELRFLADTDKKIKKYNTRIKDDYITNIEVLMDKLINCNNKEFFKKFNIFVAEKLVEEKKKEVEENNKNE